MITKLTEQQEKDLVEYRQKMFEVGVCCDAADRPRAERAFAKLYEMAGKPKFEKVYWFESPMAIKKALPKGVEFSAFWGQQEVHWQAYYDFGRKIGVQYQPEDSELLDAWLEISYSCNWWLPFEKAVLACERPLSIEYETMPNGTMRLHNATGPVVCYRDGWSIWAWYGVLVPERVIMKPAEITVEEIDSEKNAEVRRVMIERYGYDRYILESGAELASTDKSGALYRKTFKDGGKLLMIHVINSTPEPDGTSRKYVLAVHPELRPLADPAAANGELGEPQELTAHNAVASTFGLRGEEYDPAVQS